MKGKSFLIAFVLLLFALLLGCKKQEKVHTKRIPAPPPVSAGTVHPRVPFTDQAGNTFAVYLPSNYNRQKSWPVLYFFDAHARGALPLKRYHKLADEFGMIFIGANTLKNGLDVPTITSRVNNLFAETARRFKLHPRRKYIMGFSGGARTAVLTALLRDDVSGVIGCGAGFPRWNQPVARRFAYLAVAGKGDFNLSELRVLNEKLNRSPIDHWFIEFKGGHEWPPFYVARKALLILQLDGMRKGLIPSNPNWIGQFVKSEMQQIDSLKRNKDLLGLAAEYRLFISTLKGMGAIQSVENRYRKLLKSTAYQRQEKAERQEALREVDYQKEIQKAFNRQDIAYLKQLFKKFGRVAPNQKYYWMYRRLTGFMSLLGYLYAQQALQKKDVKAAENYLQIYALTDAHNADRYYLQAWLDILQNKISQAKQAARKAIDLGLDDPQKMYANPDFSVLELH